ncbi:hypothetical protein OG874_00040 [Nocardia sp. NBC_00565]|uniref:hypothetical protein n=1 Tax=Nocardia sp. NBC_00565 TaxID=2975993 RepID=UPI002E820AE3|nr:hypothetical protein [Nocardia sp. NBC_00565]WUC03643.1 hypothetical protein OG874_00040 [Nocardia sp. NBC_00565]
MTADRLADLAHRALAETREPGWPYDGGGADAWSGCVDGMLGGATGEYCAAVRPAAILAVLDLLKLIAGDRCSRVWSGSRCWDDPTLTPDCPWTADRWCECCTAQAALDALTSSLPVTSSGDEAAHPESSRDDDLADSGCASHFP